MDVSSKHLLPDDDIENAQTLFGKFSQTSSAIAAWRKREERKRTKGNLDKKAMDGLMCDG